MLVIEAEFDFIDLIARLGVSQKAVAAALTHPFNCPAHCPGSKQHHHILSIQGRLHAEASTDITGTNQDVAGGHCEDVLRQLVTNVVHSLGARIENETAVFELANRPT